MKNYYATLFLFCFASVYSQVGVNTTTPNAAFEVNSATQGVLVSRVALTSKTVDLPVVNPQGGALANGTLVFNTATVGIPPNNVTPGFYYWDATNALWVAVTGNPSDTSWLLKGNTATSATTNFIGTTDAIDFVTRTSNSERMRITASGNVGIGTATPAYKLDLANGTFGFGNSNSRTETRDNAGLQGNAGAQSGFFETNTPTNFPTGASSWWHLIDTRHNNPANNYALQIAGSFFDQDLWFRKTNGLPTTPWSKLLTSNSGWGTTGNATTNATTNFIGTTDAVDFVTRTSNAERMRVTASGNVGIGTATPNAPLQFGNTVQNRKIVLWETNNNDHNYYGLGINGFMLRYQVDGTTSSHAFFAGTSSTTSNELMRITGAGNVGIGTTAPTAQLHTTGSVLFAGAGTPALNKVLVSDASGLATWQRQTATNSDSNAITASTTQVAVPSTNVQGAISDLATAIKSVSSNDWKLDGNTNGTIKKFGTTDAFDIPIITSNAERMRVTASGNVGIGNATPNAPLQFGNIIQNRKIVLWDGNNNDHNYYGLGINSFMLRYQVEGTSSSHAFYAGTSTTTSNELMRITGTGNVGIGITAPAQRLDVQGGNARINNAFIGDVGFGGAYTSFSHYSQANTTGYGLLQSSDGNYTLMNKQNTGVGYLGFRIANVDQAVILNNGNMGVGTTNPTKKFTVENGSIRPAVGNSTDAGIDFPINPAGGNGDDAFIRYYVDGAGEDTKLLIGNNNDANDDISFVQKNGIERMTIYNGFVGIGTTFPGFLLHVYNAGTGTSCYTDGINYYASSDARLKTAIAPLSKYGLKTIMQLKPVTYTFKTDQTNQPQVGFLAQEVQKIIPELVSGKEGDIAKGETLGIAYANLVPILTKAIQEQQATIEELKKRIEILEQKGNK